MTLHTSQGCSLDTSAAPAAFNNLAFTGNVLSTNCDALVNSNSGCGVLDKDPASFGQSIQNNGGAVFAMLWDQIGVRIWHFTRANTPADLTAFAPNPVNWPIPDAFWSTVTCPVNQFFQDHVIVINTSLCGCVLFLTSRESIKLMSLKLSSTVISPALHTPTAAAQGPARNSLLIQTTSKLMHNGKLTTLQHIKYDLDVT